MFVVSVAIFLILIIPSAPPWINLEDLSLLHPALVCFLGLAPGSAPASGKWPLNECSRDLNVGDRGGIG